MPHVSQCSRTTDLCSYVMDIIQDPIIVYERIKYRVKNGVRTQDDVCCEIYTKWSYPPE